MSGPELAEHPEAQIRRRGETQGVYVVGRGRGKGPKQMRGFGFLPPTCLRVLMSEEMVLIQVHFDEYLKYDVPCHIGLSNMAAWLIKARKMEVT